MKTNNEGGTTSRSWWRGEVLGGIVTVVVLALVVFVAGSLSPAGKMPRASRDNQSASSPQLASSAQEATSSSEATVGGQAAGGPAGKPAEQSAGQDVEANTANTETKTPAWATKPGADLKRLVPAQVAGYDLSQALLGEKEIQASGFSSDPRGKVAGAVWTVREMKSAQEAKDFVTRTSKELYAKDAHAVPIDGASAYFGTDGVRYATCAYVRGYYVFEVLVTSRNVRPSTIRRQVLDAAKAFPDTP